MQGGSDIFASLLPLLILFGIFYFLVIMPQQKQAKKHKEMLESLKKGDKIVSNGGFICEVVKLEEDFIKVKLNETVEVKLSKEFVAKKIDEQA